MPSPPQPKVEVPEEAGWSEQWTLGDDTKATTTSTIALRGPEIYGDQTVEVVSKLEAEQQIDRVRSQERQRFVANLVDAHAEGGDDLCPPLRETLDALRKQEHQRVREALKDLPGDFRGEASAIVAANERETGPSIAWSSAAARLEAALDSLEGSDGQG
jgi:hypothetical protein